MLKSTKTAVLLFGSLVLITGIIYPLFITGLSQVLFPVQANGSQIITTSGTVGSALIGQSFDQPQYFWGRLSATNAYPYNASASGGSNYSVLNRNLLEAVSSRINQLKETDPENSNPIPVDLVTASGSGLDPHISIAAARYQATRIAKARGLTVDQLMPLIDQYTEGRQLGFLGEPRVNVLMLNLALDEIK